MGWDRILFINFFYSVMGVKIQSCVTRLNDGIANCTLCGVSSLTLWVAWLSISCQAESNCRLSSSRSLSSARAMVSFAARRISMARWNSCVAL